MPTCGGAELPSVDLYGAAERVDGKLTLRNSTYSSGEMVSKCRPLPYTTAVVASQHEKSGKDGASGIPSWLNTDMVMVHIFPVRLPLASRFPAPLGEEMDISPAYQSNDQHQVLPKVLPENHQSCIDAEGNKDQREYRTDDQSCRELVSSGLGRADRVDHRGPCGVCRRHRRGHSESATPALRRKDRWARWREEYRDDVFTPSEKACLAHRCHQVRSSTTVRDCGGS